jgi:hypothetical protein
VAGVWRRLLNEELHNLYASPNITKVIKSSRMKWAGHTRNEKCKKKMSLGNLKVRPFGRLGHRWEDNIRLDLRKKGWESVDWIYLSQDRNQWRVLVNMVMNV